MAGRLWAGIYDCGDFCAGCLQLVCGVMDVIICAKQNGFLARGNAIPVQIGARGAGHHDARPVIVGECDRALNCAGAQQTFGGGDAPKYLWRCIFDRLQVWRDTFKTAVNAAIIGAGDGGAGHDPDIGQIGQFGRDACGPIVAGLIADHFILAQQAAAGPGMFVNHNDICAGARGQKRRCQAGGPCPDHQDIAMGEGFGGPIFSRHARQGTEACSTTDERLIQALPEGFGPHECLVVKACAQKR